MRRTLAHVLMLCGALCASSRGSGAVTPDLQKAIRASTFEVVLKKPEHDVCSRPQHLHHREARDHGGYR
jgi:hypothetical protein